MRRRHERDPNRCWPGVCLILSQRVGSDMRSDETLGTPNSHIAGRVVRVRMGNR